MYFKDIWPTHAEIAQFEESYVRPQFFKEVYASIGKGSEQWQSLVAPDSALYPWDASSTYIKRVPFFEKMVGIVTVFEGRANPHYCWHCTALAIEP